MRRRTRRVLLTTLAAVVLGGGGARSLLEDALPAAAGPVIDQLPAIKGPIVDQLPAITGPVGDMLDRLSTRSGRTAAAYTRDAFGQAWSDDVTVAGGHDGCDTRNDILRRDAVPGSLAIKPGTRGCKVLRGQWVSPYTGATIDDRGKVAVDHVVPLADAWAAGAAGWTDQERRNFANDPRVLLAVDARSNQAKGASTPDEWVPAKNRCDYAQRWIAIKSTYRLSATEAEQRALNRILADCPISSR